MKILLLAPQPFYTPRGTPIAVRALLKVLGGSGRHQVDLLTYFQGEDISIEGVRLHRISRPPFVRSVPIGPSWQKIPSNIAMFRRAYRMLSEDAYDVMHGVEDGALLAAGLSRLSGVPYVFDMDSHMSAQLVEKSPLLWPASHLFGYIERWALRRAVGVLAVCPALVKVAARVRSNEDVSLLPDMPLNDSEHDEPAEEVLGLGRVRITYVGNLEQYQGVSLLLRAFQRIAGQHPEAVLVVVGGSEEHIAEHAAIVPRLVEDGRVCFLGSRPLARLGSILAASDILVSPRLKGINTPMKIYSYLESGRAVLATRLPTHTQVLTEEAACLVEPDEESMAGGLSKLIGQKQVREGFGRRGRELVRAEYGPERFESRLLTFYDRIEAKVAKGRAL